VSSHPPDSAGDALVDTLRAVPLFAGLPRDTLARVVGELDEVEVAAGDVIVEEGATGDALYVVSQGTVEIRVGGDGLSALGPGEWFGEMALLTGDARSATVIAFTPAVLLRLPKARFIALSERQPTLLREITRVLCERLAQRTTDVAHARRAYADIFAAVLASCGGDDRALLYRAAIAGCADVQLLESIPGCAGASKRLAHLADRYPTLLTTAPGVVTFHPGFRTYVTRAAARELSGSDIAELHAYVATLFEARGDLVSAVDHWQQAEVWPAAAGAVQRALASDRAPDDAVQERWLDAFPESFLLEDAGLVRQKVALLLRRAQPALAEDVLHRAIARAESRSPAREALVRTLADLLVAQGKTEQALACLQDDGAADPRGTNLVAATANLRAAAARQLSAGRVAEAYAWARSARAVSHGLLEKPAPSRRTGVFAGPLELGLAFLAGAVVLALPPQGLSRPATVLVATLVTGALLWARGRPDDYVVALGMGVAWVVLGVAPANVAFGGFATSTWLLMLGILGLGAALARSGLLYRITLLAVKRCPQTFAGQTFALGFAGVMCTLIVPSVQGRVTLAGPIVSNLTETLGYPPRSRGSAGLALAAYLGFSLATTIFLTGTATCLIAWGLLPEATRTEMTWARWFIAVLPLEVLTFAATWGWITWAYRPTELRPVRQRILDAQLAAFGPLSADERATLALSTVLLLGWMTEPLHGINAAWLALGTFCILVSRGVLDRSALRNGIDWSFLLFLGMIFSLSDLTVRVGAGAWFSQVLSGSIGSLASAPVAMILLAIAITLAVRVFMPWQTAVSLLVVTLTPFAQHAGLSPWIIAIIALKAGNLFFLPYQSPYYLTLYYGCEERAFSHEQARPFAWAYAAIVVLGFVACLPYWRLLGLL
jgi:anion transporter